MRNPIIRYVRNSLGEPIGCVVAIEDDNDMGFAVGWSQCNPQDQFRKKVARDIAMHRAKYGVKPIGHTYYMDDPNGTLDDLKIQLIYPEPALYKDPYYGKQPWISHAIYEIVLDAEEKFLGREVRDILGNAIR